jgi:hypothetical protein
MRLISPLRLGVAGAICSIVGLTWYASWYHSARDMIQINVDARAPVACIRISATGFLIVAGSFAWAMIRYFRGQIYDDKGRNGC